MARRLRIQGRVRMGIIIGAQGTVTRAWIIQPLGARLDERAIAAVEGWRFSPARNAQGQPVAAQATVGVRFRLR